MGSLPTGEPLWASRFLSVRYGPTPSRPGIGGARVCGGCSWHRGLLGGARFTWLWASSDLSPLSRTPVLARSSRRERSSGCLHRSRWSSVVEPWSWRGCVRSRSLRSRRICRSASRACDAGWTRLDVDEGHKQGLTSDERKELVQLRRDKRVLEMEVEILKRASAYFARENVLPK